MVILDLDYLNLISKPAAPQVKGQGALAISAFSAFARGYASHTSTVIKNQARSRPYRQFAFSSSSVRATASGENAFASASSSSFASVK